MAAIKIFDEEESRVRNDGGTPEGYPSHNINRLLDTVR